MPDCMRELRDSGLQEAVLDAAATKPLFGVCVGMQMLLDRSEEGADAHGPGPDRRRGRALPARGPAAARRQPLQGAADGLEPVRQAQPHPMWEGVPDGSYFYFVHSYYAGRPTRATASGETDYGARFTCARRAR